MFWPRVQALTFFSGRGALGGGQWNMNETESETKFDKLVSTAELHLEANSLTRVPSLKNMRSLTYLTLASNKITRIDAGTWRGVTDGRGGTRLRCSVADANGLRLVAVRAACSPTLCCCLPLLPPNWQAISRGQQS